MRVNYTSTIDLITRKIISIENILTEYKHSEYYIQANNDQFHDRYCAKPTVCESYQL